MRAYVMTVKTEGRKAILRGRIEELQHEQARVYDKIVYLRSRPYYCVGAKIRLLWLRHGLRQLQAIQLQHKIELKEIYDKQNPYKYHE